MALMPAASRASAIPAARNLVLAALFLAIDAWLWLVLPALLGRSAWLGWTLVPAVLATTSYWALLHEGIHALLHPDRRVNDGVSRLLAIGFPAPFAVLRFGHLKHHRFNRTAIDRSEVYDPERCSRLRAGLHYYPQLLIGLYLQEVMALLLVWLPRGAILALAGRIRSAPGLPPLAPSVERQLLGRETLRGMRRDSAMALALIATSAWLYGPRIWMLLLALGGRGLLISLADNAYHYGTPLHRLAADVRNARDLALPGWASTLILHFNLHAVHHRHPALPWSRLPAAATPDALRAAPPYLAAMLAQLRGPIARTRLAELEDGGH